MPQYLFDHIGLAAFLDEGDNLHGAAAFRAEQRVNLIYALDEGRPSHTTQLTVRGIFIVHLDERSVLRCGLRTFRALPALMPGLRTSPGLVKRTDPAPLVREYTATDADVRIRQAEIEQWRSAREVGEEVDAIAPKPLTLGEAFTRTYTLPRKGVFWTQGVKPDENGELGGKGTLSVELVLLDKLGWDLSRNPYALNETIRILIRTFSPILLMMLICLFTRADDRAMLKRFYAKMRTRVRTDRTEDEAEMAASLADPHRHDHQLLFPHSNWEFYKWDRQDAGGFALAILAVFGILGFMHLLLTLGG